MVISIKNALSRYQIIVLGHVHLSTVTPQQLYLDNCQNNGAHRQLILVCQDFLHLLACWQKKGAIHGVLQVDQQIVIDHLINLKYLIHLLSILMENQLSAMFAKSWYSLFLRISFNHFCAI